MITTVLAFPAVTISIHGVSDCEAALVASFLPMILCGLIGGVSAWLRVSNLIMQTVAQSLNPEIRAQRDAAVAELKRSAMLAGAQRGIAVGAMLSFAVCVSIKVLSLCL